MTKHKVAAIPGDGLAGSATGVFVRIPRACKECSVEAHHAGSARAGRGWKTNCCRPVDRGTRIGRNPSTILFATYSVAKVADWVETVDTLLRCEAFDDPTFLWWDVRPQPRFGTVEVRILDVQSSVPETAALVALVQSLALLELEEGYAPDELDSAMSSGAASELRDMMIESEKNTSGPGKRDDLTIASKTGTAETGVDPKETPPFAWYVAFAPAENPQIAVAVVVESRDVAATGGKLAAGVGRATINALVGGS